MDNGLLKTLFWRHYHGHEAALARFRQQLSAAGIDFSVEENLVEFPYPDQPGFPRNMPSSIYYFIPGSGFGSIKKPITTASASTHLCTPDGVGLNMGCPVRLARALDLLFSLAEEDRREPIQQIKCRENHLAAVEEALWLTLWKRQSGIARGGELVERGSGEKARDIDWFFWSGSIPIYLEAKFRKSDWVRLSDRESGSVRRNFFDDIGRKFPKEKSRFQRCVAGITGFAEPDDSFFTLCEKKLLSTPGLSAILFRTLLGPITVASLNPSTVMELSARLREPQLGEYPLYYRILFNRLLQAERVRGKTPQKLPEKGLLYYATIPDPTPTFRPKYPLRGRILKWSATGLPDFETVPPFLPG